MKNLYHLCLVNNSIIKLPNSKFALLYRNILKLIYNIFPVPSKFIENILNFIIEAKSLLLKKYKCTEILLKYTKNWRYYSVFKFNFLRMIKKNFKSDITVIKFKTQLDINKILLKYKPIDTEIIDKININTNAIIYAYSLNFLLCLLVNTLKNRFLYYKAIQHLLIHWMQVVLNAESYTSRGIFNIIKNQITKLDLWFLSLSFNRKFDGTILYLLNDMLFLAWCANSVLNFLYLKLDLNKFEQIIKNRLLFKKTCKLFVLDLEVLLFLFALICYLVSQYNLADDRYWYLILAIKENNN